MSTSQPPESIHESLSRSGEQMQPPNWLSKGTSVRRATREFVADNAGLLLVVISQAFFSMMNAAVKLLSTVDPPVTALQLVLVRMGITYLCSLAYMLWARIDDPILGPKGVRLLLTVRGVTGFFGLFGVYLSLQYLSLSDATVLMFLTPLCTAVAGVFFLGEMLSLSQALAGIVSMVGVVLIARPPFLFGFGDGSPDAAIPEVVSGRNAAERMMAVGASLLGVLGMTAAYTSIRAIGKRAHALHTMGYFAMNCVLASTVGMIATKTPFIIPSRVDWFALLIMMGIFGFIGQVLLTLGLQREVAWRASMALYTQIVFATIFQIAFFHTIPSWLSMFGTCLILSSAVYIAMTKEKTKAEGPKQGPVALNNEDYDHLEAALHEPSVKIPEQRR